MRFQNAGGLPAGPLAGARQPVAISSLVERSAGRDEIVGALLRDIRTSLRLTDRELAAHLQTDVALVRLLEAGELRGLPDWAETERIVVALCAMVAIDPRPILRRIITRTAVPQSGLPPEQFPARLERTGLPGARPDGAGLPPLPDRTSPPPGAAPVASAPVRASRSPGGWRRPSSGSRSFKRRGRMLMAVATPMVLIAGAIWSIQSQPPVMHAAINMLPEAMAQPVRRSLHALTHQLSPVRDGLRWIDVADPRTRKADKLPVRTR